MPKVTNAECQQLRNSAPHPYGTRFRSAAAAMVDSKWVPAAPDTRSQRATAGFSDFLENLSQQMSPRSHAWDMPNNHAHAHAWMPKQALLDLRITAAATHAPVQNPGAAVATSSHPTGPSHPAWCCNAQRPSARQR